MWQGAGLATDLVTIGLLVLALGRWRRDTRWVALYALCPAPAFEFVHNAHVDGLAVALLLLAAWETLRPMDTETRLDGHVPAPIAVRWEP